MTLQIRCVFGVWRFQLKEKVKNTISVQTFEKKSETCENLFPLYLFKLWRRVFYNKRAGGVSARPPAGFTVGLTWRLSDWSRWLKRIGCPCVWLWPPPSWHLDVTRAWWQGLLLFTPFTFLISQWRLELEVSGRARPGRVGREGAARLPGISRRLSGFTSVWIISPHTWVSFHSAASEHQFSYEGRRFYFIFIVSFHLF